MAIIERATINSSNNTLNLILNRNGANVNGNFVAIGFNNTNHTVEVLQVAPGALNFNNVQQNSVVAAGQVATYSVSGWSYTIDKALCLFSTSNSTAIEDTPSSTILN